MSPELLPLPAPTATPVIVGAGNAGLAAAARFAHHDIPVILLEKQDHIGGQLLLSGGAFSAAGTRRQKERGIQDHPDLHAEEVLRIAHGRATTDLVHLATTHAATAVDWLDDLGFRFAEETPAIVLGHEPYAVPRTYWGAHESNGARAILEALRPSIERGTVDVRTGHRMVGLQLDDAGAVTGVRAMTSDGEVLIPTDMLIIATGGYAGSRELLAALQPGREMALLGCLPHATGDALVVLEPHGIEMVGAEYFLPSMGMIENPDAPGVALRLDDARVIVDANARRPYEIWVNERGERFVNESTPSPDERERALLQQPELAFWSIWTEAALVAAPIAPIGPGWDAERVRTAVGTAKWLHRADTLEALSRITGLPLAQLQRTIAEYNSDEVDRFGRDRPMALTDGPFYAVRSVGAMLLSRGGPRVDHLLRPLVSDDRTPLGGVHLIGEVLGMSQFSGDAFAGGMSVGPALAFGTLLADSVAAAHGRRSA